MSDTPNTPAGVTNYGGRRFDWVPQFDQRSVELYHVRDFMTATAVTTPTAYDRVLDAKIAALTKRVLILEGTQPQPTPPPPGPTPNPTPPTTTLWPVPIDLDQGATGECVGYGWTHLLGGSPKPDPRVEPPVKQNPTAEAIYKRAQEIDGSPANSQTGASVLSGAKAAQEMNGIVSYLWATSVEDIKKAVLTLGPVVLGIPWLSGMMQPDARGQLHATGGMVGGHCIVAVGYDTTQRLFTLHQSWGTAWGMSGDCTLSEVDLTALFRNRGEACVPVKP